MKTPQMTLSIVPIALLLVLMPPIAAAQEGLIDIYTRAMVNAALASDLEGVEFAPDPVFGVDVPLSVPGVPAEVLSPRGTWTDGEAYDASAAELAAMFKANFKQFTHELRDDMRVAGPR